MPVEIPKDGPLADLLAKYCMIPRERIKNWAIVVQHDKGVVLLHTLCCDEHAREGLAAVAATAPDLPDISDYGSEN